MSRLIQLHLDEGSGSTTFANSGTVSGNFESTGSPTAGVTGISGNAVDFINDNVATRYLAGDSIFLTTEPAQFTVWAWVYVHAADTAGLHTHIVHKAYNSGVGWSFPYTCLQIHMLPNSSTPHFDVNNGNAAALGFDGPSMLPSTWYMLCMTYDGSTLKAYVNGQFVGSQTGGVAIDYGTHGDWQIGGSYTTEETFPGIIDEVNVDDTVFTQGQIIAEYNRLSVKTVARDYLTPPTDPVSSLAVRRVNRNEFFNTTVNVEGFFVVLAGAIDGEHIKILFSKPPVVSEALNINNYSVDNGLSITSVVQETSYSFILTTTPQSVGVQYLLSLSGIHDQNGDPI